MQVGLCESCCFRCVDCAWRFESNNSNNQLLKLIYSRNPLSCEWLIISESFDGQMMVHDTLVSLSQKHVLPGTCLDGRESRMGIPTLANLDVEVVLFLETIETDRETIIIEQDNVALKM